MKDFIIILVFVIAIKLLGTISTPATKDVAHKQVAKTEVNKANFERFLESGTLTHFCYDRLNLGLIVPVKWVSVSPSDKDAQEIKLSVNLLNYLNNAGKNSGFSVPTRTEIYSDS